MIDLTWPEVETRVSGWKLTQNRADCPWLLGLLWEPDPSVGATRTPEISPRSPCWPARSLDMSPWMEPAGREPAPGQRASPLHQVALRAQTQTLYPGCGQGPQERNGNLRFEVRKQDVIGEQWSTGVGEGPAVPAGLKGSIQGCQVPSPDPAPPLPRSNHASPPYPAQFLRLPVSCQHPTLTIQNRQSSRPFSPI